METKDIIKEIRTSLNDNDEFDLNGDVLYFRFKESRLMKVNDIDILSDVIMVFRNTNDIAINCAKAIVNANRIKDFYIL